jgi:predicted transposase YdaD
MVYRFEGMSRREVDQMLGISLQETRVYREAKEEEARWRSRSNGASLILRQLARRVGDIPEAVGDRIDALPLEALESLGEVLLDFEELADLQAWLESVAEPESEADVVDASD